MSALAVARPGQAFRNERVGDPVRRNSAVVDQASERHWRKPLTWDEERLLRQSAAIYDDRMKLKGQHNGALGFRGMKLLEFMIAQLRRSGGYLRDMSIQGYATALQCSVQTIVNAIKALQSAGILIKQRRKRELDERGPSGRRKCVQDKNIYQLQLPARIRAIRDYWCGLRKKKAESPTEMATRLRAEANRQEKEAAIIESRSPKLIPDPPHLAALDRWGALLSADSRKH